MNSTGKSRPTNRGPGWLMPATVALALLLSGHCGFAASVIGWGQTRLDSADFVGRDFIAISAGEDHRLALKSDGTAVGWGDNWYGQTTPPTDNDLVAISAGSEHSLALKSDGTITAWGNNEYGQVTPPEGNDFVAISAGNEHSLGLKRDGTILGWGCNGWGQATPPGDNLFLAISTGKDRSVALRVETPFVSDCRDLARFAGWWLSDCSSPIWCDGHDTDTSGRVEFLDFARLTRP